VSSAPADDAVGRWTERDLPVEGRVREVVRAPHPVLGQVGAEVDPTAAETVQLAADLVATMRVSPGCVGLAAPQVGVSAKLFCVDVAEHPKTRSHHGTFVLCNAVVVQSSRNEKAREGCMSVPDFTGDVKRASRLVVVAATSRTAYMSSTAPSTAARLAATVRGAGRSRTEGLVTGKTLLVTEATRHRGCLGAAHLRFWPLRS